jgi:hypothetical protein
MSAALQAATAAIPAVGPAMALAQGGLVRKYAAQALAFAAGGALVGGALGVGGGVALNMATGAGGGGEAEAKPKARFASGGVTTGSTVAMVGEQGPEMVEIPAGGRVTTAPATEQLTAAITGLSRKLEQQGGAGGAIQLAVYIGQDKIDEVVVKAIGSEAGRRVLSPYSMV